MSLMRFKSALERELKKNTWYFRRKVRDQMVKFLKDLSKGIIANSPSKEKTGTSTSSFLNHTSIDAYDSRTGSFGLVAHEEEKKQYRRSNTNIRGLNRVLGLFNDWRTIPQHIYIWNKSVNKGYDYTHFVETDGWKHTRPYKPFHKGWEYARSQNPGFLKSRVAYNWGRND